MTDDFFPYLFLDQSDGALGRADIFRGSCSRMIQLPSAKHYIYHYLAIAKKGRQHWLFPYPALPDFDRVFSAFSNSSGWKKSANRLVRAIVKSSLQSLFSQHVAIVANSEGAFHRAVREMIAIDAPEIVFIKGTEGPEQKIHAYIYSVTGEPVAHGKVAYGALADNLIANEQMILTRLSSRREVPSIRGSGQINSRAYILQEHITLIGFYELRREHFSFLQSLAGTEKKPVMQSSIWKYLDINIGHVPKQFRCFDELLLSSIDCLKRYFEGQTAIQTIMHGDFAPWNTTLDDNMIHVIDWEHALLDGLPLLDVLHWQFQVKVLLERRNAIQVVHTLLSSSMNSPVNIYSELVALDKAQVIPLLILYLCYHICRTATTNGSVNYDPKGKTTLFPIWFDALKYIRNHCCPER